jgi:squalene cyclase
MERLVGSQNGGFFRLTAALALNVETLSSPHNSNQYESTSPVKFKAFSCYFAINAVSEHEASYSVLQQPKSQPSPVFITKLLVRTSEPRKLNFIIIIIII